MPPTTPPVIAPTGVDEPSLDEESGVFDGPPLDEGLGVLDGTADPVDEAVEEARPNISNTRMIHTPLSNIEELTHPPHRSLSMAAPPHPPCSDTPGSRSHPTHRY